MHSFSPPWSGSTGMINDLLQQLIFIHYILLLGWKNVGKLSLDTDLKRMLQRFSLAYFLLCCLPNVFLFPPYATHLPIFNPPFTLICHTSEWAESYYYPHFDPPHPLHISVINVLIFPVIPGWIGSSQQSLCDKSQKAPTSSASRPGAILLTTPQGRPCW